MKYVGEAPIADMSVTTTPSRLQVASLGSAPLPMKLDCWPLSLPATFTRSTSTPGIVRMSAQGSRELGTFASSSLLIVVPVPVFLVSTAGVSDCTVIVSSTDATLSVNGRFTLVPAATVTSRLTVENPVRPTLSL